MGILYYIYTKGQLAGPPRSVIRATSEQEAIAAYRREYPYLIRADRLVATTTLR